MSGRCAKLENFRDKVPPDGGLCNGDASRLEGFGFVAAACCGDTSSWLVVADGAPEVVVDVGPKSASPILVARCRVPPRICNFCEMFLIPLRTLSRKVLDLTTTAATSSFDTVTNDWTCGSVLANHEEESTKPSSVKGCR